MSYIYIYIYIYTYIYQGWFVCSGRILRMNVCIPNGISDFGSNKESIIN